MPELFQGLLAAGIPFVVVLSLGIYIEQRWSARRDRVGTKPALVRSRT